MTLNRKKVKKIAAALALILLLPLVTALSAPVYAVGGEEGKTVRVVLDDSNLFFTLDESGNPVSGYAFDYIQTIAAYAGWDVVYVPGGGFANCMQMVLDGEADLIYDVSYTEERAALLLYPDRPMGTEDYHLYCLAGNTAFHSGDYAAMDGKRLGITAGTTELAVLKAWCQEKGISPELVEYESIPAKEAALEAGEIDLDYEISMLTRRGLSALEKISGDDYYLAANIDRADLIRDINLACSRIYEIDPYFTQHLSERYFSASILNRTLSMDEQNWLDAHHTLRIGCLDDYMPFSDMEKDGQATGIVKDLVPAMLDGLDLGIDLQFSFIGFSNAEDMLTALRADELDLIFPVCANTGFGIQKGLLITSSVFSASADIAYSGKYSGQTTAVIAVNRNNLLQDYFTRSCYPDADILYCDTSEACVDAVKNAKAGSTLLNGMRTSGLLKGDEYAGINTLRMDHPFELSFAVNKGNAALLSILNRAIVCIDRGVVFQYAFDYVDSQDTNTPLNFIRTHKLLLLTVIMTILLVILAVTLFFTVSLSRTKSKLAEAGKTKTDFLFNMSHDIRTPLNAIVGFTNIARNNLDNPEKLLDCLDKTQQSSRVLLSLIDSILEMSRIESGKADLNEIPGDVRYSFENIKTITQDLADSKSINLTYTFGEIADPDVYMDHARTMRIFLNIITNAIKYTDNGGHVRVKCEQVGRKDDQHGLYRYTFEDDGIGMSEAFQKYLFNEFSREHSTTLSGIQGTGLGLAVVKSFVDLMGGTITFESRQGIGTTFCVTLPFRLRFSGETADPASSATGENGEEYGNIFAGRKVLLVDDNDLNREIAVYILEEKQFLVEEANDGTAAVELLKEKGPDYYDFILMDIQMPTMNGYEATKAIRALYPTSDLPIIALSANAFAEDTAASLAAGMNDHIAKPINIKELFDILARYLRI